MKKLNAALAIIGGLTVVAGGVACVMYFLSDKLYQRFLPCEDDFDMIN